jgi:hypothetical protein
LWLTQLLLCLTALAVFYRVFALTPKGWHLALLLPFAALLSVKWPDAPAGCLLFFLWAGLYRYASAGRRGALLAAGGAAALLANFRSEYLLYPALLAAMAALPAFRAWRRRLLVAAVVLLLAMLAGLAPWSWRAHRHGGPWLLSATNGGGVAYISLGQLPGNPWGIRPVDDVMWQAVRENGLAFLIRLPAIRCCARNFPRRSRRTRRFAGKVMLNVGPRRARRSVRRPIRRVDDFRAAPSGRSTRSSCAKGRLAALRQARLSEAAALAAPVRFQ